MTVANLRICQKKSSARVSKHHRSILKALGFSGKLHQWKSHVSSPSILGMIHKIRHLLKVSTS